MGALVVRRRSTSGFEPQVCELLETFASQSAFFDIVARHVLQFDQSRQEGVVFHMLSSLTELGRIGLTSVGNTPERVEALYRGAEAVLLEEAQAASREVEVEV